MGLDDPCQQGFPCSLDNCLPCGCGPWSPLTNDRWDTGDEEEGEGRVSPAPPHPWSMFGRVCIFSRAQLPPGSLSSCSSPQGLLIARILQGFGSCWGSWLPGFGKDISFHDPPTRGGGGSLVAHLWASSPTFAFSAFLTPLLPVPCFKFLFVRILFSLLALNGHTPLLLRIYTSLLKRMASGL